MTIRRWIATLSLVLIGACSVGVANYVSTNASRHKAQQEQQPKPAGPLGNGAPKNTTTTHGGPLGG